MSWGELTCTYLFGECPAGIKRTIVTCTKQCEHYKRVQKPLEEIRKQNPSAFLPSGEALAAELKKRMEGL